MAKNEFPRSTTPKTFRINKKVLEIYPFLIDDIKQFINEKEEIIKTKYLHKKQV